MEGGIRAEISVEASDACPVAKAVSDRTNPITDVSRSLSPGDETIVEEFTTDANATVDDDRMNPVYTYDSRVTYRFSRDENQSCPCHQIETHEVPVSDTTIRNGSLVLQFHVADLDELESVVQDLREDYPVSIERLVQSGSDDDPDDLVFVDRGQLTERQMEVIQTAHEMGYFEYSKRSNAGDVADELDISTPTFSEHLSAAQRKLLGALVGE